jgi:RHS repeat-associated protein
LSYTYLERDNVTTYVPGGSNNANLNGTNRLSHVDDALLTSVIPGSDIGDQSAGNYRYDALGQLTADIGENIGTSGDPVKILWTVTNKIKQITKTNTGDVISFSYNAMGHRISKKVAYTNGNYEKTFYILDAQGNVMSTYTRNKTAPSGTVFLVLSERNIYGSSRVGMERVGQRMSAQPQTAPALATTGNILFINNAGDKRYELSNHLGNVLNVITDRKLPQATSNDILFNDQFAVAGNTLGWHYEPSIISGNPPNPPAGYAITASGGELTFSPGATSLVMMAKQVYLQAGVSYTVSMDVTSMSGSSLGICNFRDPAGLLGASSSFSSVGVFSKTVTGRGAYTWIMIAAGPVNAVIKLDNIKLTANNVHVVTADVNSYSDYYPYGMQLPYRFGQEDNSYRYGLNGMEKDNEIKSGEGNSYDFGARILDPRIGRWLTRDPKESDFANMSSYCSMANNPIRNVDNDGKIVKLYNSEGTLVATISKGKMVIEKGHETSAILMNYLSAKAYFGDNTTFFEDVENDGGILEIQHAKHPAGGGSFQPDSKSIVFTDANGDGKMNESEESSMDSQSGKVNGKISWDFNQAAEDGQGNFHSPAMILFHEISHARRFMWNIALFLKLKQDDDAAKWGKMENGEEDRAIKQTNEVSKKLNNGDGGKGGRTDHTVKRVMDVDKVTDTGKPVEVPVNRIGIPDKTRVVLPVIIKL